MAFNGTPLVEAEDPVGLKGGLVSISAWRNGLAIARVRMAAGSEPALVSVRQKPAAGYSPLQIRGR